MGYNLNNGTVGWGSYKNDACGGNDEKSYCGTTNPVSVSHGTDSKHILHSVIFAVSDHGQQPIPTIPQIPC